MEAEKAATYPASSVRFSFFIKIFIFILEIFRIAVAISKQLITFTPLSPARPQKLENYCLFITIST